MLEKENEDREYFEVSKLKLTETEFPTKDISDRGRWKEVLEEFTSEI